MVGAPSKGVFFNVEPSKLVLIFEEVNVEDFLIEETESVSLFKRVSVVSSDEFKKSVEIVLSELPVESTKLESSVVPAEEEGLVVESTPVFVRDESELPVVLDKSAVLSSDETVEVVSPVAVEGSDISVGSEMTGPEPTSVEVLDEEVSVVGSELKLLSPVVLDVLSLVGDDEEFDGSAETEVESPDVSVVVDEAVLAESPEEASPELPEEDESVEDDESEEVDESPEVSVVDESILKEAADALLSSSPACTTVAGIPDRINETASDMARNECFFFAI